MNIDFGIAMQYINLEAYDKAVAHLKTAIEQENKDGNESEAMEFTCVLGELYANLGETAQAKAEFAKVLDYCGKTGKLNKQREIAEKFMNAFNGNIGTDTE